MYEVMPLKDNWERQPIEQQKGSEYVLSRTFATIFNGLMMNKKVRNFYITV